MFTLLTDGVYKIIPVYIHLFLSKKYHYFFQNFNGINGVKTI